MFFLSKIATIKHSKIQRKSRNFSRSHNLRDAERRLEHPKSPFAVRQGPSLKRLCAWACARCGVQQGACPAVSAVPGRRGGKMGRGDPRLEGGTSTTASPLGEGTKRRCTHLCTDGYITLGCIRLLLSWRGPLKRRLVFSTRRI